VRSIVDFVSPACRTPVNGRRRACDTDASLRSPCIQQVSSRSHEEVQSPTSALNYITLYILNSFIYF
jgi:hypothetical protein